VKIKSSPFPSRVDRLIWAGSSSLTCDANCKKACFSVGEGDRRWGDGANARQDACVAGCGCGGGADRILTTTDGGGAFISLDAGDTWQDLTKLVPGYLQRGEPHVIQKVEVSHADPRYIVLLTNTTISWSSTDGGASWKALRLSTKQYGERQITNWRWHPLTSTWALAESFGAPDGQKDAKDVGRFAKMAFYTQDAGMSWQLLAANTQMVRWDVRPGGDSRRILLTRDGRDANGKGSYYRAPLEVIASDDFMAKSNLVLIGKGSPPGVPSVANRVLIHYDFIFVAVTVKDADWATGKDLQLWVYHYNNVTSKDATAQFQMVQWPKGEETMQRRQLMRMQILYSTQHMALIFVPASEPTLPWGHVFRCDYHSPQLIPVLTDVSHPNLLSGVSWRSVDGIEGVFISNRVVLDRGGGANLNRAERKYDSQASLADDDSDDADKATSRRPLLTRTYISFDVGTAWQPLSGPALSKSGDAMPGCETTAGKKDCFLHLSRWVSSIAAPGLILAVGNTGRQLAKNPDHFGVFVSRDAGLAWKHVLPGRHDVSILSHGDVLVAVPALAPGTMFYSIDQGDSWQIVTVTAKVDKGLEVDRVFTHPSNLEWRSFVLLNSDAREGEIMATIDFSGVLSSGCQLVNDPVNPGSDFEKWSPADSLEDSHASKRPACLLGVRTSYVRRKAKSACKSVVVQMAPRDKIYAVPCECGNADYTCDSGFFRSTYDKDAKCEVMDGVVQPNLTQMCAAITASKVEVTRGYKKIPGNRCEGGADLSPAVEICVGNTGWATAIRVIFSTHHSLTVWIAGGIVLLLSVFALVRQKQAVPQLVSYKRRKKYDEGCDDEEAENDFLLGDH